MREDYLEGGFMKARTRSFNQFIKRHVEEVHLYCEVII